MFLKLLGRVTPCLRSRSELLGSTRTPLVKSQHYQCAIQRNESVEKWIETLTEDKQKRVRHIQNEVSVESQPEFF